MHASSVQPHNDPPCGQLAGKIAALIGQQGYRELDVPGLTIYRYTAPTEATSSNYQPSMTLVAQGKKQAALGHTTFIYDRSHFLLTSLEMPVTSRVIEASIDRPYLCVRLAFDMGMVRELLARDGIAPAPRGDSGLAMTTGQTTRQLTDAFVRLLDLQDAPGDIPFLGDLLGREIVYRVLQSTEGKRLRGIATLGEHSHRTAAVVAWINENYAKPLRLEELAGVAAMGQSTLHRHFRALTAMTPLQYQKRLRLQAARMLMLMDGLDAASAAFEVGYESASQFNREYSRFFGRSPLRDVKALRAQAAAN
ncbi:AraC family transcriptional regulator [Massilia aurea]|uniref:AraC family transcriptional regulator n=1 Tax=Massilia aurea TaxID=373040 RepID=UPI00161509F5|nr:AraC family transcriptional regulator [Massilia aurea]